MPHPISSAKFVQHTTSGIFTCTWRALSCNTVGGAMWNHTCSECLPGKIALDAIYKNVQFRGPNLLLLKAMANFPLSTATFDPSGHPQKKQQRGSVIVLAAEAHAMVAMQQELSQSCWALSLQLMLASLHRGSYMHRQTSRPLTQVNDTRGLSELQDCRWG